MSKKAFVFILVFTASHLVSYCQSGIEFDIKVRMENKTSPDFVLKFLNEYNGSVLKFTDELKQSPGQNPEIYWAKYSIKVPFNGTFAFIFSYPHYIGKIIQINTFVDSARIKAGFERFPFTVVLIHENDSLKSDVYHNRAVIEYSLKFDDFDYSYDKNYNDVSYNSGVKNLEQSNYDDALKDFTDAIQFNITDVDALYNRGLTKFKMNNKEGACKDWNLVKELGSTIADSTMEKYCH